MLDTLHVRSSHPEVKKLKKFTKFTGKQSRLFLRLIKWHQNVYTIEHLILLFSMNMNVESLPNGETGDPERSK